MSSIKEQVIRETIARITKRVKEIRHILEANPLSDIISLRQEVYPKLAKMDFTSPEAVECLKKAAVKEKRLFALARKQQRETNGLITEQVELESEHSQLINELYILDKSWMNA